MVDKASSDSTNVDINSTKRETQDAFVNQMAERVRELAKGRFNAKTLGGELGIPSSSAANYWSGSRPWPVEAVPDLASTLNTNVEFLLCGTNQPSTKVVKDRQAGFRGRPEGGDTVQVSQIDLRYGLGATFVDVHVEHQALSFSRAWLRNFTAASPEELVWSEGLGDSMFPTIHDRDLVLIDLSQKTPYMADAIWAFAFGQVGMIKRLRPMPDGTIKIMSDNPNVQPETAVDDELHIVGKVVAIVRRV